MLIVQISLSVQRTLHWFPSLFQSHFPGKNPKRFSAAVAIYTAQIFIQPGTHYRWVYRGSVDSKLAQGFFTWPELWEPNPRSLDLRSNALTTWPCATPPHLHSNFIMWYLICTDYLMAVLEDNFHTKQQVFHRCRINIITMHPYYCCENSVSHTTTVCFEYFDLSRVPSPSLSINLIFDCSSDKHLIFDCSSDKHLIFAIHRSYMSYVMKYHSFSYIIFWVMEAILSHSARYPFRVNLLVKLAQGFTVHDKCHIFNLTEDHNAMIFFTTADLSLLLESGRMLLLQGSANTIQQHPMGWLHYCTSWAF